MKQDLRYENIAEFLPELEKCVGKVEVNVKPAG
jgi:hypothetical protein